MGGRVLIGNTAIPKVEGDRPVPLFTADADGTLDGAERIVLPKLLPTRPTTEELGARSAELDRKLADLIGKLQDDRYAVREAATQELARLGHRAEASLLQARSAGADPEVRLRAAHLLKLLAGPFSARLENGVIRCDFASSVYPAEIGQHLLARWWINGRAAKLPAPEAQDHMQEQLAEASGSFQVAFAIDAKALEANPTDTVEVEFLYCPMEIEDIDEEMVLKLEELARAEELQDSNGDVFRKLRAIRSNRLKLRASALKGAPDAIQQ